MGNTARDEQVREALSIIHQYLSDVIAPLSARDALTLLLNRPAQLIAMEIGNWVSAQFQGSGVSASVPDYLFHALRKLHEMGQLKLVPEPALDAHIEELKKLVMKYCPEEDRSFLADKLANLRQSEAVLASPVGLIYREVGAGDSASEVREPGAHGNRRTGIDSRRLSILWRLLGDASGELPDRRLSCSYTSRPLGRRRRHHPPVAGGHACDALPVGM